MWQIGIGGSLKKKRKSGIAHLDAGRGGDGTGHSTATVLQIADSEKAFQMAQNVSAASEYLSNLAVGFLTEYRKPFKEPQELQKANQMPKKLWQLS